MKGIADTGFLAAFANANDKHHKWAAQLATGVTEPLLTREAVIAETAFHLQSAAVALAMINEGLVALAFNRKAHLVQLARSAERFAGQRPDLADLCLVRRSELFPAHSVITVDRTDFQVYRRNKREAIPPAMSAGALNRGANIGITPSPACRPSTHDLSCAEETGTLREIAWPNSLTQKRRRSNG